LDKNLYKPETLDVSLKTANNGNLNPLENVPVEERITSINQLDRRITNQVNI
jgi:hypothetical protein